MRARRPARELLPGARGARGEGGLSRGGAGGTVAGRWEREGAPLRLWSPWSPSRSGKKLCLERRFSGKPARAQLSRLCRRTETGARVPGAAWRGARRAWYRARGPPRGRPRGARSAACGSRRPQTSAASQIWAAFLWAAQGLGVRAGGGGGGRGVGKTTSGLSGLNPRDGVKDSGGLCVSGRFLGTELCVCPFSAFIQRSGVL